LQLECAIAYRRSLSRYRYSFGNQRRDAMSTLSRVLLLGIGIGIGIAAQLCQWQDA
jgi:hypothetical protein